MPNMTTIDKLLECEASEYEEQSIELRKEGFLPWMNIEAVHYLHKDRSGYYEHKFRIFQQWTKIIPIPEDKTRSREQESEKKPKSHFTERKILLLPGECTKTKDQDDIPWVMDTNSICIWMNEDKSCACDEFCKYFENQDKK